MASLYADVNRIRSEAAAIDPVKVFFSVVAFPFVALLFVLRYLWMVPAFAIAAGKHGWALADKQVRARQAEAQGRSG